MSDEHEVRPGWLPPRPAAPQAVPPPPAGPPRPTFTTAPRARPDQPGSALALSGIVLGAIAVILLVFSLGIGYFLCGLLSAVALALGAHARRRMRAGAPGRPGQARAAIVLASIGLALSVIAAAVWYGLDASGFSPQDLQDWLERQTDRLQEETRPRRNPDTVEA